MGKRKGEDLESENKKVEKHKISTSIPKVLTALTVAKGWTSKLVGLHQEPEVKTFSNPLKSKIRVSFWFIGLAGLFISIIFGAMLIKTPELVKEEKELTEISNNKKFLWSKLALWLGALPVAVLLCSIFIFIPIDLPVFNLVYVGFIGGYGILLFVLYLIGKIPGTTGKWRFRKKEEKVEINWVRIGLTILVGGTVVTLTSLYVRTGLWYVFPIPRIFWLFVFSLFTSLGFYVGLYELRMIIRTSKKRNRDVTLSSLIGLTPFFLLIILYAAINSLSGMIGSTYGLIILALSMATAFLLDRIGRNDIITTIIQGFLVQLLILPQGVLFAF